MKMWSLLTYVCLLTSYICNSNSNSPVSYNCFKLLPFVVLKYSTAVIKVGSFRMISSVKCWHGM